MDRFQSILEAMADPGFYPHSVSSIDRRETHISAVFLTGEWAYKLKKPLDLGFLDFRNLEDRRKYCEREVELNRRLSQGVYQGVVGIYQTPDGFSLTGDGEPVEYAVRMKQLPDEARLQTLLEKNSVDPDQLKALGGILAAFYRKSEQSSEIDRYGRREAVIFNSEENFTQIEPFVGRLFPDDAWQFIQEVNRAFPERHKALFDRRLETGKIRDGHGDLRTDHIYFFPDEIQIIDCIEFNDRFRYGDVAVDLAFLHMDMEHLGRPDAGQAVLKTYAEHGQDPEIYALIDFYAAYRAIVRLKVACMRFEEPDAEREREALLKKIHTHLDLAYRHTLLFSRPTLWAFSGLPASGKSSLARRLAQTLSIETIRSDGIRKETDPQGRVVPFGKDGYTREKRGRVYARMLNRARDHLKQGRSVILDATFALREWRREAAQLATDLGACFLLVECGCDADVIRSRLRERERSPGQSDARLLHLDDMLQEFEAITEGKPNTHIHVDTEGPIEKTLLQILSEACLYKSAQLDQRL